MNNLQDVYSREKILQALEQMNHEISRTFKSLSLDEFFHRQPQKWSPCDTLRHLTMSVKPVAQALSFPKLFLRLAFGKFDHPSRQLGQIREAYLQERGKGTRAGGRFKPSPQVTPASEVEAKAVRRNVIRKWQAVGQKLHERVESWPDYHLGKYRLPHPILGKITVREMLLFTLIHNLHHLNAVRNKEKIL